ncbi:Carnosine N-methyltransferase [Halotydeus destructor]|nr:Carnosine N-methyltransferase [Halotydeus destructor]
MDQEDGKSKYDVEEERRHFEKIVDAFRQYKDHSYRRLAKTRKYLDRLPELHQQKLIRYRESLNVLQDCVDKNAELLDIVVKDACSMFKNLDRSLEVACGGGKGDSENGLKPTEMDMDKTHSVLKQLVREWSVEGEAERQACYGPIVDAIESAYGHVADRSKVNILVPGAGLGRLAHEIARRGFSCQGNECSLFMLLVSNYVLNKCSEINQHTIHPYAHSLINNMTLNNQTKAIAFPDINPSDIPDEVEFSMAAGNFSDIYHESNTWDAVATCFFIDTAHNIVEYIETIYNILRKGGIWINYGPLLYHFADARKEDSIEPCYEMVKEIILSFGFIMTREETGLKSLYTQNVDSMLKYEYSNVFFVCKKPD